MNPKTPAMAGWLLKRFGIPQRNESLMGDLVEEYGSGRSVLWFWRQTAVAISTTVARDISHHKLLALRAIATGWVLNLAWGRLMPVVQTFSAARHWNSFFGIFLLFTVSLWPAIVGWVVARTHRNQQAAMVLAYAASLAIWDIGWFCVTYAAIVGRTHILSQSPIAIQLVCFHLAFTLIGGFLQKPRTRAAEPRAD